MTSIEAVSRAGESAALSGKKAIVIGSGFAGLASASCLAQSGVQVTVFEKNAALGGRARVWQKDGFTFDLGPSWYWMPDVFEEYFARFGKKPSDYYDLERLDPSYRVVFGPDSVVDMHAGLDELKALFEQIEPGAAENLDKFLAQAEYKYRVGMGDYVRRPSLSLGEFIDLRLMGAALRLDMLQDMHRHVTRYFKDERLVRIMEFPILFLGGTAREIPAMYSLMNYTDIVGGTWYPRGGMGKIVDGMVSVARELGVTFHAQEEVRRITVERGTATGVVTDTGHYTADVVVGAGDYHHIEQNLLDEPWRSYDEAYWQKRIMSPSCLLYYLGIDKKLSGLLHHNLFFDAPLEPHAREIYQTKQWPTHPLFYVCCPSQTDATVAPEGCENVFILIPVAPGLEATDTEAVREKYYQMVMERLEALTWQSIRPHVRVKRTYAHRDFINDYHAFKGNAYGLANTLNQTAVFKPSLRARKVSNLFYCGQLTVPGPGVPPSLLSGQIAAGVIAQTLKGAGK